MATFSDGPVPIWLRTDDQILAAFREIEAGRSLKPEAWPNGARVAVALSVDVDNQSAEVRSPRLSLWGTTARAGAWRDSPVCWTGTASRRRFSCLP